ncbi:hypothetical protein [Ectobacillus panaciterrae]|uniref:hypothetical protein n=1 Tax=Ectobacillus panaciterrae TaxID=363872 RepID=UPI00040728D7|nr:hypothetical protein [Ectobacillus panaciterrae]
MIFSEWDEAFNHQDLQEEAALDQSRITDKNVLLLLDIEKQLDRCIINLEKEYGTKTTELAEIPINRLIYHILDIRRIVYRKRRSLTTL